VIVGIRAVFLDFYGTFVALRHAAVRRLRRLGLDALASTFDLSMRTGDLFRR
jgi:hypothetical protein